MVHNNHVGTQGELWAQTWLNDQGWRIVDTNWHCRYGEVDIVAQRGKDLVFFEVKTRTSTTFGYPVEAITASKIIRMRRVAGQWLAAHPNIRGRIRLDVLGLVITKDNVDVDHVEAVG
ncbi:MAG TPA: YraN family protein [Beutenbergiaceae bacterium]|nr:YraN family protein [Beutenbergiaceae bacterium]